MKKRATLSIVDLFCGAGGTSTGILEACAELQTPARLTAVNHWTTAINSHSLNHPQVNHICEPVENLWPARIIPGRRLDLLAASCECTFHSNARGGGPCKEQSRAQAWQLIRWCSDIHVENLLMENVSEFQNWGPLLTRGLRFKGKHHRAGRPDPRRKGETFRAFLQALDNLGYTVEWKIQTAANFGDATSRQRFMLLARHGRKPITWPAHSHGPGCPHPHRGARECIDFQVEGQTVFTGNPGKPFRHCANTMRRIFAGLLKQGGKNIEPYLMVLNGTSPSHLHSSVRSLNDPMPTLTCSNHVYLCERFVLGQQSCASARKVSEPLPTVSTSGAIRLVEPIIVQTDHTGSKCARSRSADQPLGTVVSKQNMLLVQVLMKYYGTGICASMDKPIDTITTKDRFLLVTFKGGEQCGLDLRTRLLQPHELKLCHSFPPDYQLTGSKEDQTTQIGNSVPVKLARAHARAALCTEFGVDLKEITKQVEANANKATPETKAG